MSVYMVRIQLIVCMHIGCWKQATYTVWDDDKPLGKYCYEHGWERLGSVSRQT